MKKNQRSHQGGCFCGAVRYKTALEHAETGTCHCTTCRKHSGAAYKIFTNVPATDFHWLSEPAGRVMSGEASWRLFCTACGTPVTWGSEDSKDYVSISSGTLDDPSGLHPKYELFTRSRMDGVAPFVGAEQFDTVPSAKE